MDACKQHAPFLQFDIRVLRSQMLLGKLNIVNLLQLHFWRREISDHKGNIVGSGITNCSLLILLIVLFYGTSVSNYLCEFLVD